MKYPQKYGGPSNSTTYSSNTFMTYIIKTQQTDGRRDASTPIPKKCDLGLAKNYWSITVTSIAAKIYNAILCNHIEPKTEIILLENQNGFRRNRSTTSQIFTIRWILEGVRAKKTIGNNIISWLHQDLWLHAQRKDWANTTRLRPTQRNRRNHNDTI